MNGDNQGNATGPQPQAQPQAPNGENVVFSSAQIAETQAAQDKEYFKDKDEKPKSRRERLKNWLNKHRVQAGIILVAILILLALLIWLIVWLVTRPTGDAAREEAGMIGETTSESVDAGQSAALSVNDLISEPSTSEDELVAAINAKLDTLTDGAERYSYLLYIADLLIASGRPELGIQYLNAISENTLDEEQRYTLYSYYYIAYQALGDQAKVDEYDQKMQEITGQEIQGYGVM